MPEMTIKEWAEEYRLINQADQQERIATLPAESVEKTIRIYFALCQMLHKYSLEAEEHPGLQEMRMKHYRDVQGKWERIARRLGYVHPS